MVRPVFPSTPLERGLYESFYLRAVSPDEPIGAWIRYTVHKRPGAGPQGSVWCTVFDATRGRPFMHKHTTDELSTSSSHWLEIGSDCLMGAGMADGGSGPARWQLRFDQDEPQLRHLQPEWLYRLPLPRTKLTSPSPATTFAGTIELADRTLRVDGWRGMVGHNWGSEHAERWIWLHGIAFAQDPSAWIDVALGRVLVGGRLTPWLASGALYADGHRIRVGGLLARKLQVVESVQRCTLRLTGEDRAVVEIRLDVPADTSAGWRYADPHGGEHQVANCSIAAMTLELRRPGVAGVLLSSAHGGAYELGMRESDHGVPLAPFSDG